MSGGGVRFQSDGCVLAGTFTAAADPVAAALLISGSGRSNRDSDVRLRGGRMLRVGVLRAVADALERARVSTLRYGKRGVGASDGDALRVGMADGRAAARRSGLVGRPCDRTAPAEGHVVGDLNHLLRPDPDSVGPRGYRRAVRQPVSPEVLGLVTGWVERHWEPAVTSAAS